MSQISQVINLKPLKASGLWLPTLFVLSSGSVLVVMIFALLVYQMAYLDRIYPGVWVADSQVGGLTPAEVITIIDTRSAQDLARPITIQAGDERWTFTGRELEIGRAHV